MNLRKDHYPSLAIAIHPSGTSDRASAWLSPICSPGSFVPGCDERERVGGALSPSARERTFPFPVWQTWVLPRYWSGEARERPQTLFGWDRLVEAGGPEVAVLHSPRALRVVCVALHSSRKVPMACSVGCFGRQIERVSSLVLFIPYFFSLELDWGRRGRDEKV